MVKLEYIYAQLFKHAKQTYGNKYMQNLTLFVKLEELHIVTARKPLIHQNQPVAQYLHKIQPCML